MRLSNVRALVVKPLERPHLLDDPVDAIVRHDSGDAINLLQSSSFDISLPAGSTVGPFFSFPSRSVSR